jgi:hypothetical protein
MVVDHEHLLLERVRMPEGSGCHEGIHPLISGHLRGELLEGLADLGLLSLDDTSRSEVKGVMKKRAASIDDKVQSFEWV